MKNQELFDKTIGILVNAYLNDTLEATDCAACAVGNLVAANNGINLKNYNREQHRGTDKDTGLWYDAIGCGTVCFSRITPVISRQIKKTGYTAHELAYIEDAFMSPDRDARTNFDRLIKVVESLMQIHEATSEEITQAKRLFVKEPA